METQESSLNEKVAGTDKESSAQWVYDGGQMTKVQAETRPGTFLDEKTLGPAMLMWLVICINYNDQWGMGPGLSPADKQKLANETGLSLDAIDSFYRFAQDGENYGFFQSVAMKFDSILTTTYGTAGCPHTPGTPGTTGTLLALAQAAKIHV